MKRDDRLQASWLCACLRDLASRNPERWEFEIACRNVADALERDAARTAEVDLERSGPIRARLEALRRGPGWFKRLWR